MIEVLRQARNAFVWNLNTDLDNIPACERWANMLRKNIDDLYKAIAELESQEPVGWIDSKGNMICVKINESCRPLYAHPPQRIEPPDWFPAVENILNEYGLQAIDFVADFKAAMKDAEKSQRTWVGLMDEEIEQSYETTGHYQKLRLQDKFAVYALAKAIEAKLKQKNGYAEEKNT